MNEISRKVAFLFSGFFMILIGGTIEYMCLEGYHATDALYLTIITVGYGDTVPVTPDGKILTKIHLCDS